MSIDDIDWNILVELQEDARISFAELGRRVGLTTPAVIERVRKLEDAGVITGYRVEIDPAKVGLPVTAFIRMSITGETTAGSLRSFKRQRKSSSVTGERVGIPSS